MNHQLILKNRANRIMNEHSELFYKISREMNISKPEIVEGFLSYNSEVEELDNSAYDSKSIRIAMFIEYLLEGSWHEERQDLISKFLNDCKPKTILDIGFGAPMRYVNDYVFKKGNEDVKLTLSDKFDSAFPLAKTVLNHWNPNYSEQIDFRKVDMEIFEPVGDYDAYILQDAIEHAPEPTKYMTFLKNNAPKNARFLLSLPIAPLIPCHFIGWLKEEDAIAWLKNCGLKIEQLERVHVNPEVDLFAESLGDIYDLMIVASAI